MHGDEFSVFLSIKIDRTSEHRRVKFGLSPGISIVITHKLSCGFVGFAMRLREANRRLFARIYDFGVNCTMRSMARVPCAAILIACIVAHTLPCLCGHSILYNMWNVVDFGAG